MLRSNVLYTQPKMITFCIHIVRRAKKGAAAFILLTRTNREQKLLDLLRYIFHFIAN